MYPSKDFNVSSFLEAWPGPMVKTFSSRFSFTPLNVLFWVVANGFCCCDHLCLNFVLLLEVDGEVVEHLSADIVPVDVVLSLSKLRSFPMLLIVSADNSVMNSKICQQQVRGERNIYQPQVHGEQKIIRIELRVYSSVCLVWPTYVVRSWLSYLLIGVYHFTIYAIIIITTLCQLQYF